MCEPTAALALAGLTLSVGSSVVGFMGQSQQAKAQNQMALQNARSADEAARHTYAQNAVRGQQERAAASERLFDERVQGLQAQSTALTGAGESGVSGLSVDALLADYEGTMARRGDRIAQQSGWQQTQLDWDSQGAYANAKNRVASMPGVAGPSLIGTGLEIGQAGLTWGTKYAEWTGKLKSGGTAAPKSTG